MRSMWATTPCIWWEETLHASWAVFGCKGFTLTGPALGPFSSHSLPTLHQLSQKYAEVFQSEVGYYQGVYGPVVFERLV